jgi:hypothetical protein
MNKKDLFDKHVLSTTFKTSEQFCKYKIKDYILVRLGLRILDRGG